MKPVKPTTQAQKSLMDRAEREEWEEEWNKILHHFFVRGESYIHEDTAKLFIRRTLASQKQAIVEEIKRFQTQKTLPDQAAYYRLQELIDSLTYQEEKV
mgnify:CR=1 FL=1